MKALVLFFLGGAALFLAPNRAHAQGALPSSLSFYGTPTYPDVVRVMPASKHEATHYGWLAFDAKTQVSFVTRNGAELKIPYRSIRALEYQRSTESVSSSKSKWGMPLRVNFGGRHVLTIRYDGAEGPEAATVRLDGSNYQQVLGTFYAKTGLQASRTGQPWGN